MRALLGMAVVLSLPMCALRAQSPGSVAEQYLYRAANAERVSRGLPALRWDDTLYHAAQGHAREMAARESISHQYPGEADLAVRAQVSGARFSVVAENVAEAPSAVEIHDLWMHSEHHRDNLLSPEVDRIGISVLSRDGQLYAVEDFDRGVARLSLEEQESAVADLLNGTGTGMNIQIADQEARQTCAMDTGYAGPRRPWFVMRFSTGELNALPDQLKTRLASGRYREAAIGACSTGEARPFSSYNIAVLLFP